MPETLTFISESDQQKLASAYRVLTHTAELNPEGIVKFIRKKVSDEYSKTLMSVIGVEKGFEHYVSVHTHYALTNRGFHWNKISEQLIDLRSGQAISSKFYNDMRDIVLRAIVKRAVHYLTSQDPGKERERLTDRHRGLEDYITLPDSFDLTKVSELD